MPQRVLMCCVLLLLAGCEDDVESACSAYCVGALANAEGTCDIGDVNWKARAGQDALSQAECTKACSVDRHAREHAIGNICYEPLLAWNVCVSTEEVVCDASMLQACEFEADNLDNCVAGLPH